MLVTLGSETTLITDIPAEVTFQSPQNKTASEARLTVPRSSRAFDALEDRGGYVVTITDRLGTFKGISDRPSWTPAGADLVVKSLESWLGIRRVAPSRTFRMVPAGVIFGAAVRDGLVGILPLMVGRVLMATPLVEIFTFERQTVQAVFDELMEITGHVYELDARGRLHWQHRAGRFREEYLIDDGRLFGSLQEEGLNESYSEVIEVDDRGREFRVRAPYAPVWWPAQVVERV